jgi:hypothetical protein
MTPSESATKRFVPWNASPFANFMAGVAALPRLNTVAVPPPAGIR